MQNAPPEWPLGSYLVFLRQPYRANVQALFERQLYPDRLAGGAPERPYDVAGWTLPMQMGVEAYPVAHIREPESQRRLTLVREEGRCGATSGSWSTRRRWSGKTARAASR